MKNTARKIEYIDIDELKAYENNPRNNDDAVGKVGYSILEFGFNVPLVIDKDRTIVTGHTRLKAAKQLGMKKVPCIIADDLTDEQVKAYRLADNKVAEFSNWDIELLDGELEELEGCELDMSSFGFDEPYYIDDFSSDSFELPEGEKSGYEQIAFTFTQQQKVLIVECLEMVGDVDLSNGGKQQGTKLYEVCKQWKNLKRERQI